MEMLQVGSKFVPFIDSFRNGAIVNQKLLIYFLFLKKKIYWGASNEYPKHVFV